MEKKGIVLYPPIPVESWILQNHICKLDSQITKHRPVCAQSRVKGDNFSVFY